MKNILLTLFLLSPVFIFSQSYNGPESVEGDTLTGNYYISNPPSGTILRRLPDGTLEHFASGIAGPHGLEIVNDVIYVCAGGGEVRGLALNGGGPVFSVQTGGTFLNGITYGDDGFLYVTDFSGHRIYKVDILNESSELFVGNTISTPNGIIHDHFNDRLVFVSWGTQADIVEVNMTDGALNVLTSTNLANIDGVALDGDGNFYVSSWGVDAVHRFEPTFTEAPELVVSDLDRPADIYYNVKTDTLGIPNVGDNTVTFVGFEEEPPSSSGEEFIDFEISVFPNPASNLLNVISEKVGLIQEADFQVFSQNNQSLELPLVKENGRAEIDLNNLLPGTYILVATFKGEASFYPFIKK